MFKKFMQIMILFILIKNELNFIIYIKNTNNKINCVLLFFFLQLSSYLKHGENCQYKL